jgi:hypothetical protein
MTANWKEYRRKRSWHILHVIQEFGLKDRGERRRSPVSLAGHRVGIEPEMFHIQRKLAQVVPLFTSGLEVPGLILG